MVKCYQKNRSQIEHSNPNTEVPEYFHIDEAQEYIFKATIINTIVYLNDDINKSSEKSWRKQANMERI